MRCISTELARNHGQFILILWVSVAAKSQELFAFIFWVIPVLVIRWFFQCVWLVNCIYLHFFLFGIYILLKNVNVCLNWLKGNESQVRRCLSLFFHCQGEGAHDCWRVVGERSEVCIKWQDKSPCITQLLLSLWFPSCFLPHAQRDLSTLLLLSTVAFDTEEVDLMVEFIALNLPGEKEMHGQLWGLAHPQTFISGVWSTDVETKSRHVFVESSLTNHCQLQAQGSTVQA